MHFTCRRFMQIVLAFALAVAAQRTSSSVLPESLQSSVPQCAQVCLASLLNQTLSPSLCATQGVFDCLCSRYSITGFTLGELALACVAISCPEGSVQLSASVYTVCDEVKTRATATHDIITFASITPVATSVAVRSASATVRSNKKDFTTLTTSRRPSTTTDLPNSSSSSGASAASSHNISAAESTSISKAESRSIQNDPPSLTISQIAGISSAIGGSLLLVILLILVISCRKRRKLQRPEIGEDRGGEVEGVDSHHQALDIPEAWSDGDKTSDVNRANQEEAALETRWDWSQSNPKPEEIGLALSPEMEFPSPTSASSSKTISRLLPEKPESRAPPLPAGRGSGMTQVTMFEEDAQSMTRPRIVNTPPLPASRNDCYGIDRGVIVSQRSNEVFEATTAVEPPSLSLEIPNHRPEYQQSGFQAASLSSYQLPDAAPVYLSFLPGADSRPFAAKPDSLRRHSSDNRSSIDDIPEYYLSPMEKTEVSEGLNISLSKAGVQAGQYDSGRILPSRNSETSIESAYSQEETPPEDEAKQLSPVAESPITGLRYPKIPRSSNQRVARKSLSPAQSPKHSRNPSLTGQGNSANFHFAQTGGRFANAYGRRHEPELGVMETYGTSKYTAGGTLGNGSDLPGRGLTQSRPRPKPLSLVKQQPPGLTFSRTEMELRSPLWESPAYPNMSGDELFFSAT